VPHYRALKRCLGMIGAVVLAVFALPVLLAAAVAVTLTSPGPILFRQRRIGKNGKVFVILKLRSMYVCPPPSSESDEDLRDDIWVTPVGRIIRSLRIDELPQLFNVLRGDMSLVGPRPLPELMDHRLATQLIGYNLRRSVRPGITGLAQVRRLNATEQEASYILEDDLEYIQRINLWLDVWILLVLTPWALLRGVVSPAPPPEVIEPAPEQPAPEAST
jgi:lipopolysaccharide/colanic/teichoic acid biosynthesis glycosyltransferase